MATMHPMSRIISVSDLPWEERQPGVKRKLLWENAIRMYQLDDAALTTVLARPDAAAPPSAASRAR